MGYGSKSLNDWRDDALRIAKEHGFVNASVGEDVALMHSELSELLEDYRAGHTPNQWWYEKADGTRTDRASDDGAGHKPCGIPSELADVIIRVLHFSGKYGIDIEQAVREKMMFNEQRAYKHGGKKL